MIRQCQAARYVADDSGTMLITRCKKHAQATFTAAGNPIDFCTMHLGSALIYGGIWYEKDDGTLWEIDMPKRFPLREEAE